MGQSLSSASICIRFKMCWPLLLTFWEFFKDISEFYSVERAKRVPKLPAHLPQTINFLCASIGTEVEWYTIWLGYIEVHRTWILKQIFESGHEPCDGTTVSCCRMRIVIMIVVANLCWPTFRYWAVRRVRATDVLDIGSNWAIPLVTLIFHIQTPSISTCNQLQATFEARQSHTTVQMKGRWESNINVWFPEMKLFFPKKIIKFYLPVPTLIYLWEIYIFPGSVCLFCCTKYVDRSWE